MDPREVPDLCLPGAFSSVHREPPVAETFFRSGAWKSWSVEVSRRYNGPRRVDSDVPRHGNRSDAIDGSYHPLFRLALSPSIYHPEWL